MFQNNTIQQLSNNHMGGNSSAVMHIFTPRHFSDQGKRPIAYKFDGRFVDQAVDAIHHKSSTQNASKIDALVKNPEMMQSIIPTFQPDYMIRMSDMSMFWTFMLIINNDKTGPGGLVRAMSDNLQLVYGYFIDEPINPLSHMGGMTVNRDAKLMITHKTIVNKSSSSGAYGTNHRLDTMADIDVVPGQVVAALSNTQVVAMRPEDLYGQIATGLDNDIVISHDPSRLLQNLNGPLDMFSKLSVPKNNIRKVLDAVADTQSNLGASAYEGSPMVDLGTDPFSIMLDHNLRDGARGLDIGLSTNRLITMGTILDQYHPTLSRVDLPRQQQYATQDQSAGSARNVFSSMLATVLPSMMADFVLARVAFTYNSHADAMTMLGVDPITPMSENDLRGRVNAFIFRLKSELFPILRIQRGHFDLQINCDCTSVTHINLNFFDDSIHSQEIFEVPTLLGGFNSPLIGSTNVSDHNATQLGMFIQMVHDTDRDVPLGQFDQASYNRSLDTYDQNTPSLIDLPDNNTQTGLYIPPTKLWQV